MYSYSYNHQGPSISRLDELLSRNELIYQNLKQKLDDINKSDLNIKRNITHIHTNYPPHIASYAQSSIIQQQNILKSPYNQGSRNLSSINQSKQLTFSEVLPQDDLGFSLQKQQRYNEIMKQSIRLRQLQFMNQRNNLEEQLRMSEISRSKRKQSEAEQSQGNRKSSNSNRRQVIHQIQVERYQNDPSTYFPPNATSKQNKFHKGNEIYLLKIPKTSDMSQDTKHIENIATFRQLNQDEVSDQKQIKQTIKTKQENEISFMQDTTQKQNRSKYILQIPPYSNQQETQYHYQPQSEEYRQNFQKIDTITQNIRKEKQFSPQDSGFKYTAVSPREANLYNELNSNIQKKLNTIVNTPQCYLFMPFNKVYRSPILQLKTGGQVLLERKSKTTLIKRQDRITDPIKYKFKSVITDQQTIIKLLFAGNDKFDFGLRQNNRVAILGKKDTLKRKLHMGLLAYILESSKYTIANTKYNAILRIQHQEVANQDKGKTVQADIDVRIGSERVAIMELERTIQDIYQAIKGGGNDQKVLRMTKLTMKGQNQWSYSIICSNRIDSEFVRCLGASRICWSANPLLKNYQDLRLTLESMRHFVSSNYI